jgi:hypothetical protein
MRLRTLVVVALLAAGCGGTEPESPQPPYVGVWRLQSRDGQHMPYVFAGYRVSEETLHLGSERPNWGGSPMRGGPVTRTYVRTFTTPPPDGTPATATLTAEGSFYRLESGPWEVDIHVDFEGDSPAVGRVAGNTLTVQEANGPTRVYTRVQ